LNLREDSKGPCASALIFKANFTAASKNSATFTKSLSIKPLEVRAGVPGAPKSKGF
jgi:hypothetical protein